MWRVQTRRKRNVGRQTQTYGAGVAGCERGMMETRRGEFREMEFAECALTASSPSSVAGNRRTWTGGRAYCTHARA